MLISIEQNRIQHLMLLNNGKGLEEHLREYHNLLDTLLYLNEALQEAKTQIKPWQKYSETLLFKFSFHGLTIHSILSGITLKSSYYNKELTGKVVIDTASAKVVCRSQLEAFLMYNHIYVNPKNDDQKELRYYAWVMTSLLQRQNTPTLTEFGKSQKARDKIEIDKMKTKIQGLASFNNLSSKQKAALLDNGSGKLFSHWADILKETGYNEKHAFSIMYAHWSSYSHSEGISAIQLTGNSLLYKKENIESLNDLYTSKLLVCLMITIIVRMFKVIEIKYNTLPWELQFDISFYNRQASIMTF